MIAPDLSELLRAILRTAFGALAARVIEQLQLLRSVRIDARFPHQVRREIELSPEQAHAVGVLPRILVVAHEQAVVVAARFDIVLVVIGGFGIVASAHAAM